MRRLLVALVGLLVVVCLFGSSSAYADLSDGLVAYYPFNGNANDESGNGHHGTVYGATPGEDIYGSPDTAYAFDGVNDYIDIPYQSDIEPDIFTVSVLFNTQMTTIGQLIGTDPNGVSCNHGYNLRTIGSANFWIDPSSSCGAHWASISSNESVNDGLWHHFVAVYDSSGNIKMYIDGILQNASGSSGYNKTHASIRIGMWRKSTELAYFDGRLDEIRIYNRALSEPEISELAFSQPVASGHYLTWWGDYNGWKPTNETTRTEQATEEMLLALTAGVPDYSCGGTPHKCNTVECTLICDLACIPMTCCEEVSQSGSWKFANICGTPTTATGGWDVVYYPTCGDGLIESPEGCDDGGATPGDGCDASCQIESGWACVGEPSVCTVVSIPTLSRYFQLALVVGMLTAGAWMWRRRTRKA